MSITQLWILAGALVVVGLIILRWGKGKTVAQGTRTTHREHHLALVVIGGTCAGLGAMFMLIEGWDYVKANPPNWWVEHETFSDDPEERRQAIRTLIRRVYEGYIPPQKMDEAINRALQDQADPKTPWEPAWGELIASARETGVISNELWQKYVHTGIDCTPALEARPKVRRGAPIPILFHGVPSRLGKAMYSPGLRLVYRLRKVTVDGNDIPLPADSSQEIGGYMRFSSTASPFVVRLPKNLEKSLPEGQHSIRATVERVVQEEIRIPNGSTELDRQEFDVTTQWTLTNAATVALVHDARLSDEFRTKLTVMVFMRAGWQEGAFVMRVLGNQLPLAVACDVTAQIGAMNRSLGQINLSPAEDQVRSRRLVIRDYDASPRQIKLILRPSADAAEETIDQFQIWGEDVTLTVDQ